MNLENISHAGLLYGDFDTWMSQGAWWGVSALIVLSMSLLAIRVFHWRPLMRLQIWLIQLRAAGHMLGLMRVAAMRELPRWPECVEQARRDTWDAAERLVAMPADRRADRRADGHVGYRAEDKESEC